MQNLPCNRAGIGLKPQHYDDVLAGNDPPGWVEVHPQNYWGPNAAQSKNWLSAIAEKLPVSFHSVGLSLGSADGLNADELERLAALCSEFRPSLISDHLSFSGDAHDRMADLLPIPYTYEALAHFARQVSHAQDRLGQQILIENPARYLAYRHNDMDEAEFLHRLITQTGCGLLLDINNIVVTTANVGGTPRDYLAAIDPNMVGEVHLAGHFTEHHNSGAFLIDDHGCAVSAEVWRLYADFISHAGSKPTLIEWDNTVPDYAILMSEADKASAILAGYEAECALA